MPQTSTVRSVNVGRAVDAEWAGKLKRTAIDKRPVTGPVTVRTLGLGGDDQADRVHHGGPDQAVYAFPRESLDEWQERLGRPLRDGVFGENLTTSGLDVDAALLGERWRVGTALFEVTAPRTPCGVFQAWLAESGWVKRFTAEARTGVYLRVLREGQLSAGDTVDVEYRPDHGITVMAGFRAVRERDIGLLRRILEIPGVSDGWTKDVEHVERQLARP